MVWNGIKYDIPHNPRNIVRDAVNVKRATPEWNRIAYTHGGCERACRLSTKASTVIKRVCVCVFVSTVCLGKYYYIRNYGF